jgi:hypothetical protein
MKKMWNKCSSIEKMLVIVSCSLFASAIVFLIYFESMFNKKGVHPDDKIAQVIKADQQVRRRMPMSFEFDQLKEGDNIGNGDSIFSGDNSQIMVKFLKGSQLVIGEQSLVVLREIDGKVDMKIEKGGVSGSLAESEEIEIKANQESVTINGEKDAQFTVSYKPGLGMEIISFDKNINVKYRGNEVALKDKKAFVSNKKGIETASQNNNTDGRDPRNPASRDPNDVPPEMPSGIELEDDKKIIPLTHSAPFPPNNQVFLHTTGGQVPIYPKEQCVDGCVLEIGLNGKPAVKKDFAKNSVPLIFLKIEPKIQADVTWVFRDGVENSKGHFIIRQNNETNISEAIKGQMQIEVIN